MLGVLKSIHRDSSLEVNRISRVYPDSGILKKLLILKVALVSQGSKTINYQTSNVEY